MCAAMRWSLPVLLLLLLATAWAGEYCEDFENGDLGDFWRQSLADLGGKWEPSSYTELKKTIPDFPEPASGDTVVYLTPDDSSSYVSVRLVMNDAYSFPAGSSIYFRYWLRSQYPQSGTLELRQVVGIMEEPDILYSLTDQSGPDVDTWKEINITIPEGNTDFKLMIFAACSTGQKDSIAIDDISVYGPTELSQTCGLATTTPEPTTTTAEPTTTTERTTTEATTTEQTTTESTTTEPTITETATTPEPTTTDQSTTTGRSTTPEPTTTTTEPTASTSVPTTATTPEPTTSEPTTTAESSTTEPTTTKPTTKPATTTDTTTFEQTTLELTTKTEPTTQTTTFEPTTLELTTLEQTTTEPTTNPTRTTESTKTTTTTTSTTVQSTTPGRSTTLNPSTASTVTSAPTTTERAPTTSVAPTGETPTGVYCEDFENGDLGDFWRQSLFDLGGRWEPSSYTELKKTIPDFPEPASGDTVVYLTPDASSSYVSARLLMNDAYSFPAGSSICFRYWLRSQYPQSGTLEVRQVVGIMEEPDILYSLTDQSGPDVDVDTWKEINITIPEGNKDVKLMIFAACSTGQKDSIAIDDISVYGPTELSRTCGLAATTPEPTTTTPEPTTTTTTELTTTTEPATTPEPTTPGGSTTLEPASTVTSAPITTERAPTTSVAPTGETPTGVYCEDFENGDLGYFWRQSPFDLGGRWEPSSYTELKKTIPDFPEPASGDTVVYLTPDASSSYVSARLLMNDAYSFPAGSSIYFRYWLRSQYPQSGTLEVRQVIGTMEEPDILYSLTDQSGPDVDTWKEINITIPEGNGDFKLMIFAACSTGQKDNIAIDDISVYGPTELSRTCGLAATTPEPTTTTAEPTTTTERTTTEATTTEPTTTESTTTEPTTTETATTPEPTTSEPTTTKLTTKPATTTDTTTFEPTTLEPITKTEPTTTQTTTFEPTTLELTTLEQTTTEPTTNPTRTTEPTKTSETTTTTATKVQSTTPGRSTTLKPASTASTVTLAPTTTERAPTTSVAPTGETPTGVYCEDFENGDLDHFWRDNSLDYGSKWAPSSYQELKKTIPDFPEPASGDTVVYLTPNDDTTSYVSARLLMNDAYSFPAGSSIYFRYWLRSKYVASGTLELRQVVNTMEMPDAIYSLTDQSGPHVDTWKEVNITIPEGKEAYKLMIFAACSSEEGNNIVIDDISVYGPTELSHVCMN